MCSANNGSVCLPSRFQTFDENLRPRHGTRASEQFRVTTGTTCATVSAQLWFYLPEPLIWEVVTNLSTTISMHGGYSFMLH